MAIETATIDQITNDGGGVQENDLLEISRNQITYKANINAILTRITNAENSITTLNGQVFINIKGNWDAATNTPNLLTITNKTGDAYKVNIAGSTDLDGETDWQVNDLAVYGADSKWFKIDNTQFSEINDSVIALNTTYSSTKIDLLLNTKVDKITGKGLSTNDFDNTYKATLDNLTENVQDIMSTTLVDTNTIDFVYDDENNNIIANIKDNSILNTQIANNANIETSKIKQTTFVPLNDLPTNGDLQNVVNNKFFGKINNLQDQINARPVGASDGNKYWLTSQASTIPNYELLSRSPDPSALDVESITVRADIVPEDKANRLIHSYISTYDIGSATINGGDWIFDFYGYVSHISESNFEIDVFKRAGTIETLLFTTETTFFSQTTQVSRDANRVQAEITLQEFACNPTDKIVIKIYGKTDRQVNTTITLLHSGTDYASHVHTPLVATHNQLAGIEGDGTKHISLSQLTSLQNLNTNLALKQDKTDNALATTSKTVVGAINELKAGKNIKTWYISGGINGSGSDNNNGYNQSNAFATLSKLNTVLGNTGEQVVLLPSALTESATFTQQNIEITGSEASHRGICGTSGTITSNHSASSQTYSYFSCGSFIKQNAYVRLHDLSITNSFSDSGSGVIDAYNLLFNIATPISITGSGIKNFYNQRGGVFTINNIGAQVNVVSNDYISQFTLTAGLLSLKNCIVYVAQGTTFTIGSTGTTFLAEGVKFLYPNNAVAKINIPTGVSYSVQNGCVYDVANSTLNGTDIAAIYQGYFANIAIKSANLTQSTALNILATDINKNIQSLSTATYPSLTELSYVKGTTSPIQTTLDGKENAFAKNTAFNKNFGNTAGTVAQGNDARLGTKAIDEANIGNNKIQVYNAGSGKLEYQDKPTANLDISTLTTKTTPVSNDFVVLGDSEAGNATKRVTLSSIQSSTSSEMVVEIGGEVRDTFVSSVDIPLDLTTYPINQISISSLTNNTNNIRLRGILLDSDKQEIPHNFKWTGNSRNENNVSTNEYNGAVAYFPIASERITNGVGINNISTHNITIQKQDSLNTYIRSEYNYLGADSLIAGGYSDINAVYNQSIEYAQLTGLYTQSTIYASDNDVGTNQNLLKDNSFATGAGTSGSGFNWITIDLNQVKGINKIYLASPDSLMPGGWSGGSYTNGCTIEYSSDGSDWTSIAVLSGFGSGTTQDFLVNITARYIRVRRDGGYVALSEFQVYRQLSTTAPVISYLRVYATSGMIKLNSYIYGVKKTTTLQERTKSIKAVKTIKAVKSIKAVKTIKVPQYA